MRALPVFLVVLALLLACGDDADPDAGFDAGPDGDAVEDASPDVTMDAPIIPPPPSMPAEAPYSQYVDPFIASGGLGFGVGSAFPGPQMPFGLARPGPDTSLEDGAPGFSHCGGYHYDDDYIWGFSQVRAYGVGVEMYGNIAVMPVDGMTEAKRSQWEYRSTFSKDNENAEVGYYSVLLDETDTRVEITATDRVGLYRMTFGEGVANPTVLIDPSHVIGALTIQDAQVVIDEDAREVRGYTNYLGGYSRFGGMPIYFSARFDAPFTASGTWDADGLNPGETTARDTVTGAWLEFDLPENRQVHVDIAVSFTDVEHAQMNLVEAAPGFDAVRTANVDAWNQALSRFDIDARTEADFRMFYTAVYHALFMPTLASDVDGAYRGLDGEVHSTEGRYFTDFSLWDTFRTQVPFLSLFYPELMEEQLDSLMRMAREGGYMPRWPMGIGYTGGMVGDSADLAFADALAKGVPFDVEEAYALLRRTAFEPTPPGAPFGGRSGIESYMDAGWVAMEAAGSSTSWTLEMAYDDWGLAAIAEAAGETEDAAALRERAGNWRNTWNPEAQFFTGRFADGSFPDDLDPLAWQDYFAEGNVWQYLWYVPHDPEGLAELMGGREGLLTRLDEFFQLSTRRPMTLFPSHYYWHGNEPDIHAAWIYSHFDRPDDTSRWVRWIVRTYYDDTPAGLPGNDDSGTLSSWLAFAYLGFYPITGWDEYYVATPIVTRATVHLPGGDLVIEAPEAADEIYVREAFEVNGTARESSRLNHDEIVNGGQLRFDVRR